MPGFQFSLKFVTAKKPPTVNRRRNYKLQTSERILFFKLNGNVQPANQKMKFNLTSIE